MDIEVKRKISETWKKRYENGYIHPNIGKHWKIKDTSNYKGGKVGRRYKIKDTSNMGKGNNKGKRWKIKDTSNMRKGNNRGKHWKIKDTSKWSFTNNGFKKGEDNIAKRPEIREKMRISAIEYIKNTKGQISPRQGKYEKKILDEIQNRIGFPIKRQFYINGYFLDGYCQTLNLAIEIDEEYHYKNNLLRKRDLEKQDSIINTLKCNFLRIRVSKLVEDTNLNYKYIEKQVLEVLN